MRVFLQRIVHDSPKKTLNVIVIDKAKVPQAFVIFVSQISERGQKLKNVESSQQPVKRQISAL
jgi:hypothetical protein